MATLFNNVANTLTTNFVPVQATFDASGGFLTFIGPGGVPFTTNGGSLSINTTAITGGTSGRVLYDNAGILGELSVTGTGNVVLNNSPTLTGTLTTGTLATNSTTSTTPVLSFNASNSGFASGATVAGSYLQTILQNKSGTAGASTNYVLSNDLGTDSTYYGEFGMNSSVYSASPADFFSLNNGIYLSGHDGDISIGSGNGYKTYFAWGTVGQSAHVINASGAIGLNTNITGTTNFGTAGQVLTSQGNASTPTWTTVSGGSGLTVNTTTITGGTSGRVLYDNAGTVGELSTIGTGNVVLADSPTLTGTVIIGSTSGTAAITLGRSGTSLAVVNINTGSSGGKTTNIATNASSGTNTVSIGSINTGNNVINVATGTGTQTINIASGLSTGDKTINIGNGGSSNLFLDLGGNSTYCNIGIGGFSNDIGIATISRGGSDTQNIFIGSTTGTSITTLNGFFTQQTYTVATLPTGVAVTAGARSFVTNALSPVFGATVVGGGAVNVPVYHDGTNWKVG